MSNKLYIMTYDIYFGARDELADHLLTIEGIERYTSYIPYVFNIQSSLPVEDLYKKIRKFNSEGSLFIGELKRNMAFELTKNAVGFFEEAA